MRSFKMRFLLLAFLSCVVAFQPTRFSAKRTEISMSVQSNPLKIAGALLIGASLMGSPAFAKEGAGAKFSFFGDSTSTPYTLSENREDPIYSPYSPYGNGEKAVYNARKGGKEELSFWNGKLTESLKRVDKVPGYVSKKTWTDITTELTRYTYDQREALQRVAASAKDSKAALEAAKIYTQDLNDMFQGAVLKKGDVVTAAYQKSLKDIASFKALTK